MLRMVASPVGERPVTRSLAFFFLPSSCDLCLNCLLGSPRSSLCSIGLVNGYGVVLVFSFWVEFFLGVSVTQ